MPNFEPWDVIKVPFPYTDRPVRQRRPALVVADDIQREHGLVWVLMITSAENHAWHTDVNISNLDQAGLPADSVVRTAKIATIQASEGIRIGSLPMQDRVLVEKRIREALSAT